MSIPKDSVLAYESALKADSFLMMARGTEADTTRAKTILHAAAPAQIDLHGPSETSPERETALHGVT